jgi:flagellar basal-body rod protein FlgB
MVRAIATRTLLDGRPDSMDLFNIPLFHQLTERMGWLGAREKVIAQNIANADTPGYQPRDVVPLDFEDHLKKLAAVEPQRTDPKHLTGTLPAAEPVDSKKQKKPYETAPAGNSVVLEEQMNKLSQTQADYEAMVNLYKKHLDLLMTAIGHN